MSQPFFELHDFKGGIHPAENKHQSTELPVARAPMPSRLVLPLNQHIGAPARVLVQEGDKVLKGQLIASAEGFVSAALHAPTSGTISRIAEHALPHSSGMSGMCIEITPDGSDTWCEHQGLADYRDHAPADLLALIKNAGIAGLGGAGFPSHVKLASSHNKPIDTLILNGAECEPYITADDMLMRERAAEVIEGALILLHILNPERCLIGIEDNKPEAIVALKHALQASTKDAHKIQVIGIPTKYPSGGEKQLIQILTGKEVPSGGIPADIGVVCQNVGTAAAIHNAISKGEPLISRIVTLTGKACAQPRNYEVLIGTPVNELMQHGGIDAGLMQRLIMGGPMMGFTLTDLSVPVVKTTNCLLAPTKKELPVAPAAQACIRCGMCTEACPAQLLPQQLYWFSRAEEFDKAEAHNLFDCIECGACAYVCPSNIPLVQYYRYAKGEIRIEKADKVKSERAKQRFEARTARLDREQAEKDARRAARAEAAAKAQAEKAAAAPQPDGAAPANTASAASPAPVADLEALQKKLDAAKLGVEKSKEKLAAAIAEGSDKAELLQGAVDKAMERMKALATEIAQAKKAAKAAPAAENAAEKSDPNSPERIKNKLELAQSRLQTAQERLSAAKAESSDLIPALQTAVEKQQAKVDELQQALQASLAGDTAAPAAPENPPATGDAFAQQTEQLQQKVLAAQSRVDKAQERLSMAIEQGSDVLDALRMGLDKQQQKLSEAQAALAQHLAAEKA
ncbi:MAG: electron transport complex subunit RsxC [Oceanospirillaceae bacterium]|nr:electron transport complex subunit RsxC [Oceanospirillaceae bacterium]MCP5334102.1 electron transport complex subunit RsxC [Oceanospirillaceae bacterium]MCP5351262.1 electron transport complex subunit RsxC [Oceanospirillaceae bacterium]